ncbi:hypothetical protein M758_2G247000 [Ceratodon purpureus]|uniref:Uncharacterized protein n=1 Tax=Ceratodon purpureus TaxID=3225 RepID=A0A8T0J0T1_CERPU|nr:hypothetical protein KC19_2G293000 [Ceratodon purpureus]KAG0589128.1 hypothetical protein KC19_2G293000 [Ceratodon purpureus]KAG0628062.1 hypothetical protein M758_2G247000 [Ceratodon purpureus]
MPSIGTITYWCYITAVLFQAGVSLSFIFSPPMLVSFAADSYAHFFIRVTGICLLSLTQIFWGFRHISFQDSSLGSYSYGCARLFAKFHTMMAMLLFWAIYNSGMTIPNGQYLLGLHLSWATIMTYALVQHHRIVHGYIIDTTSAPAAAKSFKQLVQGDDGEEARSVLQMIKGEDSSSKSVLQMLQDEIKTD